MSKIKKIFISICTLTFLAVCFSALGVIGSAILKKHTYCEFDRNELGPVGDHGQWYWEIYKCDDGTYRRQLVAGQRG